MAEFLIPQSEEGNNKAVYKAKSSMKKNFYFVN